MVSYTKIDNNGFKWEIKSYLVKGPPMSDEWWEREMKFVQPLDMDKFKKIMKEYDKKLKLKNNVK